MTQGTATSCGWIKRPDGPLGMWNTGDAKARKSHVLDYRYLLRISCV